MKFFSQVEKTETLLVLFGLCFVILGWFALSLTLASLFLMPLLVIGFVLVGALSIFIGIKLFTHTPIDFRVVFLIAILYAALIGFYSEPTVFSGRDQGSIAEAAFQLAHNGQLAFSTPGSKSFFQVYGPGTALNFPGFAYTREGDLITAFPLGYTAWLATFVTFFGIHGLAIGNGILLFLFLLTLYALLRLFVHPTYALYGFALAAFSFLPTWFAKITLTENFCVFLFTFLVYNLILFLREGKFICYVGILLTAGLFAFTRLEGFAFLIIALIVMFWSEHTRNIWKTYPWKSIALPGVVFTFFFLRDFFLNLPYYKVAGKGLFKFAGDAGNDTLLQTGAAALGSVFFLYGLLVLFVVGLFGILVFLKERRYILLLPALIALPTFVYLFSPNITLDHPWMLRRYLFSLFPALLFSAVIGIAILFARDKSFPIEKPQGKRYFFVSIIFLSLLFLQYPAWSTGLTYADNRTLLKQVSAFSQEFSNNDLILIDRFATGSGFAMLSGPAQFLYGKNTVYFFNPSDLGKIDLSHFDHTYLLVPEDSLGRYTATFGSRLVFKKSIDFTLEQFESLSLTETTDLRLPEKTSLVTHDLLFQIY